MTCVRRTGERPVKGSAPVGVLGAGQWGTVLALLLARNGRQVLLYDRKAERVRDLTERRENRHYLPGVRIPQGVTPTSDLALVFESCRLVLPIVPAPALRGLSRKFARKVKSHHILVHGIKGLEPGSRKRMSQVLREETGTRKLGAISGPNLAVELARGLPGATVVASASEEVISAIQDVLTSPQLRVYGNPDLVGVEWAGALKNILAIAAGIIHAKGLGQNALAMLLTRGIAELSRLIAAKGAHSMTLLGLAGIGDVIATCTSPLSRNFRAGQMLARGRSQSQIEVELAMTVEGFNTARTASEEASRKKLDLPITSALSSVIHDARPIDEALRELMERPATFEFSLK